MTRLPLFRLADCGICVVQVTPMMDRELIVLTNTQLGFIDFIVAPLLTGKPNQTKSRETKLSKAK